MNARSVIHQAVCSLRVGEELAADQILAALSEAGYTVARLEEADNYMDDEPVFRITPDPPEQLTQ